MNRLHVEYSGSLVENTATTRLAVWTGRVLTGLAAMALVADSSAKLLQVQPVIDGTIALGYPRNLVFTLGVILFLSVVAYLVPRTSVLGALLLTAYLGGAVATHVRVESPLFSHTLVPVYLAAVAWGGLLLRDPRLRDLLPLRSTR